MGFKKKNKKKRFMELLDPISTSVQHYVRHLAWNQNDAEDIFQIAISNAYKKFDTFEEGTNFKAWFYRFITFAALNTNRRHQKFQNNEYQTDNTTLESLAGAEILEKEIHYEEVLERSHEILDQMPDEILLAVKSLKDKQKAVFLLRTLGDLQYDEIAKIMDIPIGTVMGELFRARKNMRESLTDWASKRGLVGKTGGHHA